MSDRISRCEARISDIDRALVEIQCRLGALEARYADPTTTPAEAETPVQAPAATAIARTPELSSIVTLVGRTFVVLGGAFLLRALTDSGRLPGPSGIVLGLAYAVAWFGVADRDGVTRPLSGLFHGLTAMIISLPLVWEASTHFRVLSPSASAVTLVALTGVALVVAWHRRLQSLAGVAVIGFIVVTLALMIATTRPLPFGAALLALGVSTAWLSDARGWSWLRWPPAFAADGLAVALLARSDVMSAESHRAAIILLVALFAVYMLLVSWRAFVQDRRLQASEMIQAACAVAFGLFGALFVARSGPPSAWPILGGLGVVAAVGAYSAVFGILRRRMHARANVVFFTTLGLVLLVVGGGAVVAGHARVAWCGAFAIAAAVVGARASEPYLSLHGALLCIVMAGVSGAIGWASSAWFTTGPWGAPGFAYVVTGLVVAGCLFLSTRTPRAFPAMARLMADTSRAVEAALILVGGGAVAIWFFGPIVAGTPIDSGALATFRTAVLAGAGLGAAALSRFPIFAPVAWLVYPVLAAGGVKLVFDDFPHSAAATLFAALAMYGVALIVAPRLARRS